MASSAARPHQRLAARGGLAVAQPGADLLTDLVQLARGKLVTAYVEIAQVVRQTEEQTLFFLELFQREENDFSRIDWRQVEEDNI